MHAQSEQFPLFEVFFLFFFLKFVFKIELFVQPCQFLMMLISYL